MKLYAENLNLPLCWSNSFAERILLCEISIIVRCYTFRSPKYSFSNKFLFRCCTWLIIVCFIQWTIVLDQCIQFICFTWLFDWDCVGSMSLQKLFCYHLPTRWRAGIKLGDADTSPTYLPFLMFHAWLYIRATCFYNVFIPFCHDLWN